MAIMSNFGAFAVERGRDDEGPKRALCERPESLPGVGGMALAGAPIHQISDLVDKCRTAVDAS
jgi:hypothetical protein